MPGSEEVLINPLHYSQRWEGQFFLISLIWKGVRIPLSPTILLIWKFPLSIFPWVVEKLFQSVFSSKIVLWSDYVLETFILMHAELCLTLCKAMDCSLPGSSVHEISQAKIVKLLFPSPGDLSNPGVESHIGREILYHWATWEAPSLLPFIYLSLIVMLRFYSTSRKFYAIIFLLFLLYLFSTVYADWI